MLNGASYCEGDKLFHTWTILKKNVQPIKLDTATRIELYSYNFYNCKNALLEF